MAFNPQPKQTLQIDETAYQVAEHPAAPGMPYGQEGRAAVVYKLTAPEGDKALKVFKSRFRSPDMVMLAEKIAQYASIPGMQVCSRQVLTPQRHRDLIRQHIELNYAVLMPWIEGPTWLEMTLNKEILSPAQTLKYAKQLADLLLNLEQRRLAHCDLSGSNMIITPDGRLELVDVEGLYAPGLPQPEVIPAGSPGYAHRTAPQGLWGAQADRFAGAVLLAEILGACDERIQEAAWGESYFDPRELQNENQRYDLLIQVLGERWGNAIPQRLQNAWNSSTPSECPPIGDWHVSLPDEVPEIQAPTPSSG